MAKLWNELRGLTANRTGVPDQFSLDEGESPEIRRGGWLVILAVAIAFAIALQMEADAQPSEKKAYANRILEARSESG